jgi:hypothetical protein
MAMIAVARWFDTFRADPNSRHSSRANFVLLESGGFPTLCQ